MNEGNFVERVHAYSKWLLRLETGFEDQVNQAESLRDSETASGQP